VGAGTPPFAHLHVASSHSLRYGATLPEALAQRAAELDQSIIALTDRDGLYAAVRWARECSRLGMRPVLGVDIAVESTQPARVHPDVRAKTPARGGSWIDETRPRVLLIATGARGWASLCRIVSAAHTGEQTVRGEPWVPWSALRDHSEGLVAILGADSEVGRYLCADRPVLAEAAARPWRAIFDRYLALGITSHRRQGFPVRRRHRYSTAAAARMLGWARQQKMPAVLTNAVRYAHPENAGVAEVLDASRLLVPLSSPRIERQGEPHAYLKSGQEMAEIAAEIAHASGSQSERGGRRLLEDTWHLAQYCALDPGRDLGLGEVFVPELDVLLGRSSIDPAGEAGALLRQRCLRALPDRYAGSERHDAEHRLEAELRTIVGLGFSGYFLTVAEVVDMVRAEGIRVAARGSGAGSLVTHLLGISGVDPIRHGLLMERFLSPLRRVLPDIDIDVESARRLEVYDLIRDRFGDDRVASVSMMETYRVRHAVRDVGSALGMDAGEVDAFAKAFPHVRARQARSALSDLPELRNSHLGRMAHGGHLDHFFDLVEGLDGLPRSIAMHPCGVVLSDTTLLDRTPVEDSAAGYRMSHFDKHDVEHMGLLKLDVLGVRMQSAIAHAVCEIERNSGERIDLDTDRLDDPQTFELIRSTKTLGCFQIESPGQRELLGKFAPDRFSDLIIDISLFRPGPVKSDMVTPFLMARQGWRTPEYPHPDLEPILRETYGVVVFHEQVLRIIATMTGCSLAEADECRRSMGSPEGQDDVRAWFYPTAINHGYDVPSVDRVWEILRAFASFGFCKAHAAAFALPTYQSAWLKTHHPAAFYAGVLTHDPGMYPKRLLLDDARVHGIAVRGIDVNVSEDVYRVEADRVGGDTRAAIRIPLTEVSGISDEEVQALVRRRPFSSLADAVRRAGLSRPTAENLIITGAFDSLHPAPTTRRDLLLQLADIDRHAGSASVDAQLSLDLLGSAAEHVPATGLPDMKASDRVRAEMSVLGLDVSAHVIDFYKDLLAEIRAVASRDLLKQRSGSTVWVAGVKVAIQSPPVRSGRRVIFVTLDDSTGPIDAAFFEDVQEHYSSTLFSSWLVIVRGELRRSGPKGVSMRATGCWDLGDVRRLWKAEGIDAVRSLLTYEPRSEQVDGGEEGPKKVLVHASGFRQSPYADIAPAGASVHRAPETKPPSKLWHSSPGVAG
jgi:error-prone DNA polymerase